jgi:hypothetical protein
VDNLSSKQSVIRCDYCMNAATNIVNIQGSDGIITLEVCDFCYLTIAGALINEGATVKEKD